MGTRQSSCSVSIPVCHDNELLTLLEGDGAKLSCRIEIATPGAKLTDIASGALERCHGNQEVLAAGSTGSPFSSLSSAIRSGHEDFHESDGISAPSRIAGAARWDQVTQRIVESISVDMINNEISRTRVSLVLPSHDNPTPVTRMRAWTNVIEENHAMFQDASRFLASQGMAMISGNLSVGRLTTGVGHCSPIKASASDRTELSSPIGGSQGLRTHKAIPYRHEATLAQGGQ